MNLNHLAASRIVFTVPGATAPVEVLRFEANGDIYVKGRFTENDKEVVEALRIWLKAPPPHVEGRPRFERILEREVGQIDTTSEKP